MLSQLWGKAHGLSLYTRVEGYILEAYVAIEWADEFLAGYLGGDGYRWFELREERRGGLLVQASVAIDLLDNLRGGFRGRKTEAEQFWAFPRDGAVDIPERVKMACALEAFALSDDETAHRRRIRQQGVSAVRMGDVQEHYLRLGIFGHGAQHVRSDVSEVMASMEAFGLMVELMRVRGAFEIKGVSAWG